MPDPSPIRDLGGGLVLRRGTAADIDALVAFYADVFRHRDEATPNAFFGEFVRDLARTEQPPYGPHNFAIVEETASGAIVSSLNLVSQTWTYEGIPFGVGRVEPVGTLPQYRRRGLVRVQFDLAHCWSAERGELAQAITGIPYFYRQFGYEYTIEMNGMRQISRGLVPKLKEGEAEPYRLRPATEQDLPFIKELTDAAAGRYLITAGRDEAQWRHELRGRHWMSQNYRDLRLIETGDGDRLGYLAHGSRLWGTSFGAYALELRPGLSWAPVVAPVLRYLLAAGESLIGKDGQSSELLTLAFYLGDAHPAYRVLPHGAMPSDRHYPYLIRVPDLAAFLRHVGPALERRLAESPLVGHSGELKIGSYRSGVRLAFEQGRLATAEAWQPTLEDPGQAAFPDLTFLKLLFGYRDLDEIRYIYPDAWADDAARPLLAVLFPKRPSWVWPVG